MTRLARSLFIAATLVAAAGVAHAQESVDALVKKGIDLRRQLKDREALAEFQKALAISRTPKVLAQVALAEQAIGLWVKAEVDLEEAMAAKPADRWIEKNRGQLQDALQTIKAHLGSVEIWGSPDGAEVAINGEVKGTLPLANPVRSSDQQVTMVVRAKGFFDVSRVVNVSPGSVTREHVELRPISAAPPPVAAAAGTETAQPVADLTAHPAAPSGGEAGSTPVYERWWFWTAVGVVAVGAGAGAYLLSRPAPSLPPCTPPSCSTWTN
jgi:hypothetical protein